MESLSITSILYLPDFSAFFLISVIFLKCRKLYWTFQINRKTPGLILEFFVHLHHNILFSLVSAFSQKNKTYKMCVCLCVCACVCVCVCVCVCLCVCVQFWSPPNNFHTSYAIDTKFWLHIVSYRNSPTPLIPFLNF